MKILVLAVLLVLSTTVCKYTYYTERRTSKHNNMLSTLACKFQLCTRETLLHTGIYRQREQIQNCHSVDLIMYTMT